jgi:hypothetical protein
MDSKSYTIRVPKRWARAAVIVGVLALIVAPLTAGATHTFDDVVSSHTFHEDIAWLEASGVTKGCNPPANNLYCPDDDVTRDQMSAFMSRFAQYLGAADGTPAQADNANTVDGQHARDLLTRAVTRRSVDEANLPLGQLPGYTNVSSVQIVAPSKGAIVVYYSLSAERGGASTAFRIGVSRGSNCSNVDGNTHVYGSLAENSLWDTAAGTAIFTVGSGTHGFTLCGHTEDAGAKIDASSLTAMFVADGTNLPVVSSQGDSPSQGFGD